MKTLGESYFDRLIVRAASLAATLLAALQVQTGLGQVDFDYLREMQRIAVESKQADWGYWGSDPSKYSNWTTHSNRLIPVYTFGIELDSYRAENSCYRSLQRLQEIYGEAPLASVNSNAEFLDQTDLYRLQCDAVSAGKRFVFLVVFDGMDWQTARAAAIYQTQAIAYESGRGHGLCFQDYRCAPTDFGWMVTSPSHGSVQVDIDRQAVLALKTEMRGGYHSELGGAAPWSRDSDANYLMGRNREFPHLVADSASSATSMTAGIKTYNSAINVDRTGTGVEPIAQRLQREGWGIGVVTSVPISHATPACAYANNVDRDDYQDISRDLLGLRSSFHRDTPLPGVDVLIGCGWGESDDDDRRAQGQNFEPGNRYLADSDLRAVDLKHGGQYLLVQRTAERNGGELLALAARQANQGRHRLFGFFGTKGGHLPYRTADGRFDPVAGVSRGDSYAAADVLENPSLAEMTRAALSVLHSRNPQQFWMMVEAGDVDWANHNNNLDDAIGAVLSGDAAFREIVAWIEAQQAWNDSAVIITSDHGHMLNLTRPQALIAPGGSAGTQ